MKRVARALILSVAASATVATTVQFAAAGDRQWRRHQVVKPWKQRVIIGGVAAGIVAGAVVASRPRVIYRERPVVIEGNGYYDGSSLYDEGGGYVEQGDTVRRVYRDDAQETEDYALPYDDQDRAYEEGSYDDQAYGDQRSAATEDDYFPERPAARADGKRDTPMRKQATTTRKTQDKRTASNDTSGANLKPWSSEWKQWCAQRFASFNPQNGTYLGYDQKRYFCKAGG